MHRAQLAASARPTTTDATHAHMHTTHARRRELTLRRGHAHDRLSTRTQGHACFLAQRYRAPQSGGPSQGACARRAAHAASAEDAALDRRRVRVAAGRHRARRCRTEDACGQRRMGQATRQACMASVGVRKGRTVVRGDAPPWIDDLFGLERAEGGGSSCGAAFSFHARLRAAPLMVAIPAPGPSMSGATALSTGMRGVMRGASAWYAPPKMPEQEWAGRGVRVSRRARGVPGSRSAHHPRPTTG